MFLDNCRNHNIIMEMFRQWLAKPMDRVASDGTARGSQGLYLTPSE